MYFLQPDLTAIEAGNYNLWVRSGLSTGVMGSLSTVSTWVNELHKLSHSNRLQYAYRYALITVAVAQVFLAIVGGIFWLSLQRQIALEPCTVLSTNNCTISY